MHDDLVIPASYDVWLTDLKHHLDRTPGSKAALARYLAKARGLKEKGASVSLLKFLRGDARPGVDMFLDMAHWLQQQSLDGRTARTQATDDLPPRREVIYTSGGKQRQAKVQEE